MKEHDRHREGWGKGGFGCLTITENLFSVLIKDILIHVVLSKYVIVNKKAK